MKTNTLVPIILMLIFVSCESSTENGKVTNPLEASISNEGMIYSLSISRNVFKLMDTLNGTFTVTNQTGATKSFYFPNIQQLGFRLDDSEGKSAMFHPYLVSPATSVLELQNGQSKEYLLFSTFQNHTGIYINPKEYSLIAFLLNNNSSAVKLNISIQ